MSSSSVILYHLHWVKCVFVVCSVAPCTATETIRSIQVLLRGREPPWNGIRRPLIAI